MTATPPHAPGTTAPGGDARAERGGLRPFGPVGTLSRRGALAGLAGGSMALATGLGAPPAAASAAAPGVQRGAQGTQPDPSAPPATPGAMQLFTDPSFDFSGLSALGAAGMRASEVGEVLTAVNTINTAGLRYQTYVDTFLNWGDRLAGEAADAKRQGHDETARWRALRASQYYAQALFYVLGTDTPGSEENLYRAAREQWDRFAGLCDPPAERASVPYGPRSHMPVWFFRPDRSGKPRPTVILTNGSDGQNVDMWTYGVFAALERGWNALVYDGPGQGEMLFVHGVPFTSHWERAVSPLVDWLCRRGDVDHHRIAITGLSMAGALVPRAAAFEHRLAAVVAMPGVVSPWLAFPEDIREIVTDDKSETNRIWNAEVVPELPEEARFILAKRLESFDPAALRDAREGRVPEDLWTPAQRIKALDVSDVAGRIEAPTLVLDYEDEQFYPGQAEQLFGLLRARKDFFRFTSETGSQLHCSPMTPQRHCEVVFDWLERTLRR